MNGHTHSLAEWASMVCMAASGYGSFSFFYFLLVDAALTDFDPRPALRRLVDSGRLGSLLIVLDAEKRAARDAALDAAALFVLLTTRPKGAMTA
jgi:hypothetical protein